MIARELYKALGSLLLILFIASVACSSGTDGEDSVFDTALWDHGGDGGDLCRAGCDDDNPCTEDHCAASSGCTNIPLSGTPCEGTGFCQPICFEGQCGEAAKEICDGIDNTCDLQVDEGFPDSDNDGVADCADEDDDNDGYEDEVDCAPLDPSHHPGLPEQCDNGVDDNCNGLKDGQDPACTLDFKLALHLPFDQVEGAASPDASDNGHDATFINGPLLTEGKYGMGVSLDGFDDFVKLPDPPDLKQGPARSVSLWFKAPHDWRPRTVYHQEDIRDLNQDGFPDLIISNHRDNQTWNLATFVYWGSPGGYEVGNRTELETSGATGQCAADINKDGHMDLLTSNAYDGVTFHLDSYIHWGSPAGISSSNRTEIPTVGASGNSVVDINRDGFWDLVISNQGDNTPGQQFSTIFWGSSDGISEANTTKLPTVGASANSVFDLNNDGHLDIVFAFFDKGSLPPAESLIFWGSASGFQSGNSTGLPTLHALGNSVADMNCDGYLDVAFSNYFHEGSYNVDSPVFWGGPDGFDGENRTDLPGHGGSADSIADVNGDGWLDFLITNFYDDVTWTLDSYIYWGSPQGFSPENKQGLLTRGSAGNSVGDLNQDGYPDILWGNNRVDETVIVFDTYVFWGSADGFSNDNFTGLPSQNVHGVAIAGSALNGASSAHGTQPSDYGAFQLYLEDGNAVFSLTDFHHDQRELKTPYSANSWHHMAAVYHASGKGMVLYLDGEEAAALEVPVTMGATFPWRVRVGADSENQCKLAGVIDELRVYDRALSPQEAAYLFENPQMPGAD